MHLEDSSRSEGVSLTEAVGQSSSGAGAKRQQKALTDDRHKRLVVEAEYTSVVTRKRNGYFGCKRKVRSERWWF